METSKLYNFEDFTKLPRICFLLCGYEVIDTNRTRQSKLMLQIYHSFCVCCHIYVVIFVGRGIINWDSSEEDLLSVFRYATLVSFLINANFKYLTSRQKVSIKRLNDKLVKLYPKSTQEKIDYRVEDYIWPRPLVIVILFYFGAVITGGLGPVLQSAYTYLMENHFPYLFCCPCFSFNPEQDPLWLYCVNYIADNVQNIFIATANLTTDLWMVCFERQICMHFDYIGRLLEKYQPHHTHDMKDREFLLKLVDKHIQLMELQEDINTIFGGSLLFSILSTAGFFCAMAINIQVQGLNLEGIALFVFVLTATTQFYLVCHFGERINTLSTNVAFAAYNQNWHNASPSYRKYLLMIIIRAQRPVELRALGYLSVSMDTFKFVFTVTYRVIALIRQFIE